LYVLFLLPTIFFLVSSLSWSGMPTRQVRWPFS
jgi:hypothetical protein